MATFVLVHGAWHGSWCWSKVAKLLEAGGHEVHLADLPGNGSDNTDAGNVSLNLYAEYLADLLDTLDKKVYLLGHSMGGMAISATAELCPEKIKTLIYLSGFLPRNGESLVSLEGRNPRPSVQPCIVPAADGSCTIRSNKQVELFFHDCTEQDKATALKNMTPQALAPLAEKAVLSEANFDSVPRYYIELTADQAISIELQRDMIAHSPCRKVYALDSSHSPFLSKAEELTAILNEIALA